MAASILRPAATDGENAGEVSSLRELEEDATSEIKNLHVEA